MKWAAYGEGWRFTSEDGEPRDTPVWGTVLVVQPGEEFSSVIIANVFYYRRRWWGADLLGFYDQIAHYAHEIDAVRFGRQVPAVEWRRAWALAQQDWPRLKWRFERHAD